MEFIMENQRFEVEKDKIHFKKYSKYGFVFDYAGELPDGCSGAKLILSRDPDSETLFMLEVDDRLYPVNASKDDLCSVLYDMLSDPDSDIHKAINIPEAVKNLCSVLSIPDQAKVFAYCFRLTLEKP